MERSNVPYVPSADTVDGINLASVIRTVGHHPNLYLCSGRYPAQSELQEISRHYEGVLLIFQNIEDELAIE